MRITLARISWVRAPRGVRFPPQILRLTTAGTEGVFCAPVGRVHIGGPQEGEHGRALAVEMGGEALGRRQRRCRVDEPAQVGEQAPMSHREAMIGDRVRITPIAERQGVGEDDLHAARPGAPRMVGAERATPAEQMRQTALVPRGGESAIRRPPVADQDTGEVRAQDGGRVVKTAPGRIAYTVVSGVANAHSQCNTAPTRQPGSSGLTTGLPRIWVHRAP